MQLRGLDSTVLAFSGPGRPVGYIIVGPRVMQSPQYNPVYSFSSRWCVCEVSWPLLVMFLSPRRYENDKNPGSPVSIRPCKGGFTYLITLNMEGNTFVFGLWTIQGKSKTRRLFSPLTRVLVLCGIKIHGTVVLRRSIISWPYWTTRDDSRYDVPITWQEVSHYIRV